MGSLAAYIRLVRENRNFRRLWLAQIVSELGDWFYSLAVYSLILELTGSAKLVRLSRTNIEANAESIATYLQLVPKDMGALTLPASGLVYIDTMTLIYTVEPLVILDDLLKP